MNGNFWAAIVIAIAAVLAAAVFGGRYSAIGSRDRIVYVVDRFTGSVKYCVADQCEWSTIEAAKEAVK